VRRRPSRAEFSLQSDRLDAKGPVKRSFGTVVEVVKKPAGQIGFAVLPRRWVVERTFSWLVRWRRLVRDYERLPETHEALVHWAMLNRLAPPPGRKPWTTNKRVKTPS
jgi:hypothetical protein